MRPVFAIDADSNVLQFASFSFDAAVLDIVVTLTTGATLVLATPDQRSHPDQLTELIRDRNITAASIVALPAGRHEARPLVRSRH